MNCICPNALKSPDPFQAGPNQKQYESSQMNLTAVSREQSADITLVTKEGDRVTLAFDSSFEAAYATYDRQARMNGADSESRGRLSSVHVAREITLSVEGDLNEEEKKEIKEVVGEIFKMMKNFLSDPGGDPTVSAVKDIELDTLANVEAKFEVSRSVLEVNHMSAEYVRNSLVPAGESDREPRSMDRLINRISEAVRNSKAGHDRFLKYFEHRPARMSDEYLAQQPDSRKMRKMVRRIMAGLFHQLENMATATKDADHSKNPANEDTELLKMDAA
jgi:hypothetical protein